MGAITSKVRLGLAITVALALGAAGAVGAGMATDVLADARPVAEARAGTSSPSESVFVPVTPCRLVDTRKAGGQLASLAIRRYPVHGDLTSQGGAISCRVPRTASAIELNMTAVSPGGSGYLRAFPAGATGSNSTFLNYAAGFNASNAGTVALTPGAGANLGIQNYQRPTHVVIDVLGYYVEDLFAVVSSSGALLRDNGATAASRAVRGTYNVTFDRDISGCAYQVTTVTPAGAGPASAGVESYDPFSVEVYLDYVATGGARATVDREFHLTVDC